MLDKYLDKYPDKFLYLIYNVEKFYVGIVGKPYAITVETKGIYY